jgi:hypothetical protein
MQTVTNMPKWVLTLVVKVRSDIQEKYPSKQTFPTWCKHPKNKDV